jgi:hypothetical protein
VQHSFFNFKVESSHEISPVFYQRKNAASPVAVSPFTAYSQSLEERAASSPPRVASNGFHLLTTQDGTQQQQQGEEEAVVAQPGFSRTLNRPETNSSGAASLRSLFQSLSAAENNNEGASSSLAAEAYASALMSEALEEVPEEDEEEEEEEEEGEQDGNVLIVPRADDDTTNTLGESDSVGNGGSAVVSSADCSTERSAWSPVHNNGASTHHRTTTASSPAIVSLEAFLSSPADANPFQEHQEHSLRLSASETAELLAGAASSVEGGPTSPLLCTQSPAAMACPGSNGSMQSVDLNQRGNVATTPPTQLERIPLQEICLPHSLEDRSIPTSSGFTVRQCELDTDATR